MNFKRWLTALFAVMLMAGGVIAVSAGTAFAATCTSSTASGGCGPYSDPNVYTDVNGSDNVVQDVWNTPPNWTEPATCDGTPSCQTLTSNGDSNWTVAANMYNSSDTGSVKSYPDTQVTYTLTDGTTPPMSNFGTTLASSWGNIDPTGTNLDYEYAYDIWLNTAGTGSWNGDQEIMVWTDNHGQRPAGNDTGTHFTDAQGVTWEVWTDSGSTSVSPSYGIVTFVRQSNAVTGSVDLMSIFNYLKNNGYTNSNAGVDQIDYGVEICNTNGANKTFGLNTYTLEKNGQVGGGGGTGQSSPVVTTNAATNVISSGATLNGSVNPEGADASYQFDYGTSTSYGSSTTAGDAGSGSSAVSESAGISGLAAGTTYHYRIEATNSGGTSFGGDQTFTTAGSGGGGGGTVALDAATGAKAANTTTLSWTHTVSGSSRALLVDETVGVNNDAGCSPSATYDGIAMTEITAVHTDNQHAGAMVVWGLVNPPTGAHTVHVAVKNCSGGTPSAMTGGAESFTGVSQSAPWGAHAIGYGYSTQASVTDSSASSSDLMGQFVATGTWVNGPVAPVVSQFTENENVNSGAGNTAGGTEAATGGSVTGQWSVQNDYWGSAAVDIAHS